MTLPLFASGTFQGALPTAQELNSGLKQKKWKSVDELLFAFPLNFRKNYSFVYNSHSMQPASPRFPRIVLFDNYGKFMITYSGDPLLPEYSKAEAMTWNERKLGYDFHDLANVNGKIVHTLNPPVCFSCHGDTGHANWDSYNSWRGTYGSISRFETDVIGPNTLEKQFYDDFLATTRNTGRYLALPRREELPESHPSMVEIRQQISADFTIAGNGNGFSSNDRLNYAFTELNGIRVANLLMKSSRYQKFKHLIAFTSLGCSTAPHFLEKVPIQEAIPKELLDQSPTLPELEVKIKTKLKFDFEKRVRDIYKYNKGDGGDFEPDHGCTYCETTSAQWAWIANRMSMDVREWSHEFDNTFIPTPGFFKIESVGTEFLKMAVKDRDLQLNKDLKPDNRLCSDLARQSKGGLTGFTPRPIEFKFPRSLVACISCHAPPNNSAITIPFHDVKKLKPFLRTQATNGLEYRDEISRRMRSSDPEERMPRDRMPFTSNEIQTIERFLHSL